VELIDVKDRSHRYLFAEDPPDDFRFWVAPDLTSSYFQDYETAWSEERSIDRIKVQLRSDEEREGFQWN
jgi:hypothetical protein